MRDTNRFTDRLRDLAVAPTPRAEHREALRAELRAKRKARPRYAPLLVAAVAVLVFGATLLDEGVLESTGYRYNFVKTIGDTTLVLSDHEEARSRIGFGDSQNNRPVSLTEARIAEVQSRMEQARLNYETGAVPLFRVYGTVFNGQESYQLFYRTYFGNEFMDYPVETDKVILDPRFYEYCGTESYRRFAADVATVSLQHDSADTLYFNDVPVVMRRWRRVDPVYGEIELSEGYPLR